MVFFCSQSFFFFRVLFSKHTNGLGMRHDALIKLGMLVFNQYQLPKVFNITQEKKIQTQEKKRINFVVFVTCNIHACRRTFVNEAIRTSSELDPRVFLYIDRNTIFNESNQIRSLDIINCVSSQRQNGDNFSFPWWAWCLFLHFSILLALGIEANFSILPTTFAALLPRSRYQKSAIDISENRYYIQNLLRIEKSVCSKKRIKYWREQKCAFAAKCNFSLFINENHNLLTEKKIERKSIFNKVIGTSLLYLLGFSFRRRKKKQHKSTDCNGGSTFFIN